MPTRSSTATWNGSISDGSGSMRLGGGAWEGPFDVPSRFEEGDGTNPEELIAAAHAGCFSMQLSALLTRAGHDVSSIETSADVTVEQVDGAWTISRIHLTTEGEVAGLDADGFQSFADDAKGSCPVSKALAGPEITLDASLRA